MLVWTSHSRERRKGIEGRFFSLLYEQQKYSTFKKLQKILTLGENIFLPFWVPVTFTVGKPTIWGSGNRTVACSCGCSQEFSSIFLSRGGSRTVAWQWLQEALSQKAVGAEVLHFPEGYIAPVLNSRHDSAPAVHMLTEWDSPAFPTHELGAVPHRATSKTQALHHSACTWQHREAVLSPCLAPAFSRLRFLHLLQKQINHGTLHKEPVHLAGWIEFMRWPHWHYFVIHSLRAQDIKALCNMHHVTSSQRNKPLGVCSK